MYADIRGNRIFFDVNGASVVPEAGRIEVRKIAMLAHGGPGVDHMGMKVAHKALESRMQMVFWDHRGHGRSGEIAPEDFSLDDCVEDMEALRRYLGLGPIVSIGVSFGGMVAMAHAARYPDSVSHLVLAATASHRGMMDRAVEIVAERGTAPQQETMRKLMAGEIATRDDLIEYFRIMGPLYGRTFDEAAYLKGSGGAAFSHEIAHRAFAPGGHSQTYDLRKELKNITSPTLILAGRHDFICAPEFSVEMHQLIQGSTLKIFEDSSHYLTSDEPRNYIDSIAGFLVHNKREPA